MRGRNLSLKFCAFGMVSALSLLAANAEARPAGHGHDFHGRDFHGFNHGELGLWRGGHWIHDFHDGRFAWWWTVDGFWYFYPEPIYPYPMYVPPALIVQQAPPVPTGLPPAQSWYYCDNPNGYYPYVASCNGAWREVPVTPPAAPQK